MKKFSLVGLILLLLYSFKINEVYASEDALNLNTEELKNKKDDYSSLTDINGLNIFTNDMNDLLKQKEEAKSLESKQMQELLFTSDFQINEEQESFKNSLFKKTVFFDKTASDESTRFSITPLLVIATLLFSVSAFILTQKYYNRRERVNSEDNDYIYE